MIIALGFTIILQYKSTILNDFMGMDRYGENIYDPDEVQFWIFQPAWPDPCIIYDQLISRLSQIICKYWRNCWGARVTPNEAYLCRASNITLWTMALMTL